MSRPVTNITIISTALTYGGGERYVERVAKIFRYLGFELSFIVRCKHLQDKLRKQGYEDITWISGFGGYVACIKLLLNNRQKLIQGMVHLNGHRDIVLSPFIRILGLRSIAVRHTELLRDRTWRSWIKLAIYRFCIPFSNNLICVSNTTRKQLDKLSFLPPACVIPNWLEEQELVSDVIRTAHTGALKILIVARLDPLKGHRVLFQACRELDNVSVDVLGGGESSLIAEFGDQHNITFHGFSANPENYYQRADVFVLPTYTEGSPLGVIEAMGAGLPVILSDISPISEFITHNINGLLFPPGDIEELRGLIRNIRDDADLRLRLGKSARQYVVDNRLAKTARAQFKQLFDKIEE